MRLKLGKIKFLFSLHNMVNFFQNYLLDETERILHKDDKSIGRLE